MNDTPVIHVEHFQKTFRIGLRRKPSVGAVDITFSVEPKEIFGFLGPNGAGKTTTIKALLGLIRADKGRLLVLGYPAEAMEWRKEVGYLPEHPTFYEYLTGFELVTWFGQLAGLARHAAETAAKRQLERVKLSHAMHRRLRSYSKGMLQRAGLAQALVGSPRLLILDEPMTGLDPIGRKDMRELILELRAEGRTVFYSTHILPDVEVTCDRVAIIHAGKVERVGRLDDILKATTKSVSVRLARLSAERIAALAEEHPASKRGADWIEVDFSETDSARRFVESELSRGAVLEAFEPNREDLEALFMRTLSARGPIAPEAVT